MRVIRDAVVTAVILGLTATPALAQVDGRVTVDTNGIREAADGMRAALQSAFGPEFRRDLQEAAHDVAGVFEGVGRALRNAAGWDQSQRYKASQTDRETRRFTIGATGQLDLETLSGDVTIRRGSARDLVVEIIREARGTSDAAVKAGLAETRVVSEERGGRVTIKTAYPRWRRGSGYAVSVSYVVSAPEGTRISTKSMSGNITIDGIHGELSVTTMSGDVTVTDAARLASAKAVSGDVTLTHVGAEDLLEASAMSGAIVITGVKARRLDIGAISGSVTARGVTADEVKLTSMAEDVMFEGTLTARGRYAFTSHSGDVFLTLDGKTGFSFEGSTFSGSVRSELALQGTRTDTRGLGMRRAAGSRSLSGTFGDGSAVVTATSFSGDVVIRKK